MKFPKRGRGLGWAAPTLSLLVACVPTPAQLLQQMTGLEQLTVAASVQHAKVCTASQPSEIEPPVCGILISCFAELQRASGTCRDAIAQGRTSTDEAYSRRARACVQESRVAAVVCPKAPTSETRSPHVP